MLSYKEGRLHADDVPLDDIAEKYGTPVYVYSTTRILDSVNELKNALTDFNSDICFPAKCNFNLSILDLLKSTGISFDVASGGELHRLGRIGADTSRVVFTGVGKSRDEINYALDLGIRSFHVESEQELYRIEDCARIKGVIAPVSVRVNPDVIVDTHANVVCGTADSKFGVPTERVTELYNHVQHSKWLAAVGIHCHIGSQITTPEPFFRTRDKILSVVDVLEKHDIRLQFVDLGGGYGVSYKKGREAIELNWKRWIKELVVPIARRGLMVILEPGRLIMADAGVMLTTVEYIKHMRHKRFCVVDAGMNDFMRPVLYGGYHEILNTKVNDDDAPFETYDVVGPLCECEFLGLDRELCVEAGDILAVLDVGAYGSNHTSNFSSRPRPAEVLIDGKHTRLIRQRETYDVLMSLDIFPQPEITKNG